MFFYNEAASFDVCEGRGGGRVGGAAHYTVIRLIQISAKFGICRGECEVKGNGLDRPFLKDLIARHDYCGLVPTNGSDTFF